MFYLDTIITLRIIMTISSHITFHIGTYNTVKSCNEIAFLYGNDVESAAQLYPECINSSLIVNQPAVVYESDLDGLPEQISASLDLSFGIAI